MRFVIFILACMLASCGAPESPKAYVTSQKGGITVIDIATKQVIDNIDIQSSGPSWPLVALQNPQRRM